MGRADRSSRRLGRSTSSLSSTLLSPPIPNESAPFETRPTRFSSSFFPLTPLSLPFLTLSSQTIFSTELDLLLIRLYELSPVVSRFFILESTNTFTGDLKRLILPDALKTDQRFKPFKDKITFEVHNATASVRKGESPWVQVRSPFSSR